MNENRPKQLLIITVICVLLLGGFAILWYISRSGYSAQLSVDATPLSSTIRVNGRVVKTGIIRVRPGNAHVVVTKSGFASQTKSVTAQQGKIVSVSIALISNSATTANWYATHPEDQKELEIITGRSYNSGAEQSVQKTPLIASLPHIDNFYRVDYGQSQAHPDDPNATAIYITYYSQDGKQQALDWIKFKGFDPASLEIIYVDKAALTP